MPEGPELRHSRDALQQFVGLRVDDARTAGGRYATTSPAGFVEWVRTSDPDARLLDIDVKGKFMWWRLGRLHDAPADRWHLFCTYGMTGGWTTLEPAHPAFVFELEGGVRLSFDDVRHFGTLKFTRGQTALDHKLASLGPDMLAAPPGPEEFAQRILRRPRATLAEVLMDQRTVCGVGNYGKAESLWHARLSPHRQVHTLTVQEIVDLHEAVVTVLSESYALGGATIESYRDPEGKVGAATARFACYARQHDPQGCVVIPETTLDGRTTWWCPERQR